MEAIFETVQYGSVMNGYFRAERLLTAIDLHGAHRIPGGA
jgi:hypothetical protein